MPESSTTSDRGSKADREKEKGESRRSEEDEAWLRARRERIRLRTDFEREQLEREQEMARLQREFEEARLNARERLVELEAEEELALRRAEERESQLRHRELDLEGDRDRSMARARRGTSRQETRPMRRETVTRRRGRVLEEDDALDPLRDLPEVITDETGRLVRGLSNAYLEQANMVVEVAQSVADSLLSRGPRPGRRIVNEPRRNIGGERLSSRSISDALYTAAEIPSRAMDEFYRAYSRD